jgi:hypothetical protein
MRLLSAYILTEIKNMIRPKDKRQIAKNNIQ